MERLDRALTEVREHGQAILIQGEAGIGKTALVAQAVRRATELGMRVLSTTGVECETHLPFAGLHQLLRPVLSTAATADADETTAAQREAIRAALGMSDLPAPALFRTALAALEIVADLAERQPVLLVADDVQWLDRPTWDVLTFIGRRLDTDPIVLLASSRDGHEEAGFAQLQLRELDEKTATALLDERSPDLEPPIRARVLDEAAGNPLALVELPKATTGLGDRLPTWLPLTTRLEQAFATRVSDLPPNTRSLLRVAAVHDSDALGDILAAAGDVVGDHIGVQDLEPASTAGLIDVDDDTIRFRHPLIRSSVYQHTTLAQRHAAHAALADQLTGEPDRQVWHRAASRVGSDERVAADLDAAAERATRRGAIATAQAARERAAQLSAGPVTRGGRLLAAAEDACQLGRHDSAIRLLRDAEPLDLSPDQRTQLIWLRESLQNTTWSGAAQVNKFIDIADKMRQAGATDRSLDALLTVAERCWWSNPDQSTRDRIRTAAELSGVPDDDPRLLSVLAQASPTDRGPAVIERLERIPTDQGDPQHLHLLGSAAAAVGAFEHAAQFLTSAASGLRAQGRLGLLAQTLAWQAWTRFNLGRPGLGVPAAHEAARLAEETGQPIWTAVARAAGAALAGRRGDATEAAELAAQAESVLTKLGAYPMLGLVQLARGVTANGAGQYADAFDQLRRIFDPADTAYHRYLRDWAVADLVEAAAHSGRRDDVHSLVAELVPLSPLLRNSLMFVEPLLADDEEAETLFRQGLDSSWPFNRARIQLGYGAWLRRQRRNSESRSLLRAAGETFDAVGAAPWRERAAQELRASGEVLRHRASGTLEQLTPQELQIAQMAADGLTNREIGDKLYVSHRTVSTHLYRIYPKLGLTSRSQLRDALADLP